MAQQEKVIDFMGIRRYTLGVSLLLVVISIFSLAFRGLNLGMDFTGGALVELHYSAAPDLEYVRDQLDAAGFDGAVVVQFGSDTELLVRLERDLSGAIPDTEALAIDVGEAVVTVLRDTAPDTGIDLMRSEIIGAQMEDEMIFNGVLGVLGAFFGIFVYIAVRFQKKFAAGTVIALVHNVIILLGLFSVLQLQVDLTVLAAGLAVIGYSINDTVVVADRIRENFRIMRKESTFNIINASLTQTLGRTLMTAGTSLIVLVVLFWVGGELIHNFSVALIAGILVGTYSSIYVAAAVLLWLNLTKEDLVSPVKEGAEQDELR